MFSSYGGRSTAATLIMALMMASMGLAITPQAHAEISGVSIVPDDDIVNAESYYDFAFESDVSTQTNTITIIFPPSFIIQDGTLGSMGNVNDLICSGSCVYDGHVSTGSGEGEGFLPVASMFQTATDTIRITLASNADLSADTITFRIKSGIQNPDSAGDYEVSIKTGADATPVSDTVTIYGDPENFGYIVVTPDDDTITADETSVFTAIGYDANGNFIGDVTEQTNFEVDWWDWGDGGDMVDETYYPDHTGTWTIEGCYVHDDEGEYCDEDDVTVTAGVATDVAIMDGTGGNTDDYIDSDFYPGESNTYYSNLVDQKGNYVENVVVDWSLTNLDDGVAPEDFVVHENDMSATFNAHLVGSADIGINYNEGEYTDSLYIDVYVWDCDFYSCADYVDTVEISPASDTITADETASFSLEAFDGEGNSLGDVTNAASFSISEGAEGSFDGSGEYDPQNAGEWTVTAWYGGESDNASLTVEPGTLEYFEVTPSTYAPTTDDAFTVTLTAYDAHDNIKTDYTGSHSVAWSWNAGGSAAPDETSATLPADGNQSFSGGEAEDIAGFYLPKTETARITATADAESGTSDEITVGPGTLDSFTVVPSDPSPTTDVSFSVTMTAYDAQGNVKTDYDGAHSVTWSYAGGASASSPAGNPAQKPTDGNRSFSDGILDISGFKLVTVGTTTLSATADAVSEDSDEIVVAPGVLDSLVVAGVTDPLTAGDTSDVTVTARDAEQNVKIDYTGLVAFSSSDDDADLPEDYTFLEEDEGAKTFSAGTTFYTAGEHELSVSDADADVSGDQSDITVRHDIVDSLLLEPETHSPTAGVPFELVLTALDQYGNVVDGDNGAAPYTGRVALSTTASGSYSLIPNPYTFIGGDEGSKSISVTFTDAQDDQSIAATDLDDGDVTGLVEDIDITVPGNLSVTGIEADKTYATVGGDFEDGFHWRFSITVPQHETEVQLKFGNLINGDSTILADGNIEYYSAQSADNTEPDDSIVVAGTDYGDAMEITGDLDNDAAGRQIEVVVRIKVPEDATGGSYTGTYGVKSSAPEEIL